MGLGAIYGESVQAVAVTAASWVPLKVCMAPETKIIAPDDPGNTERSGVIAIMFRVEDGWAQPVVTGSAVGSRWWSVATDRRCVMRPAPVVARVTSVFAHDGRSR